MQDQEGDKREADSMDDTNHDDEQEHTILQNERDKMEQLGWPSLYYEIQQNLSGSPNPRLTLKYTICPFPPIQQAIIQQQHHVVDNFSLRQYLHHSLMNTWSFLLY